MERHEHQPGTKGAVDARRSDDAPATRADAHRVAILDAEACCVFGRDVERLRPAQWGIVAGCLHAGVERLESPPSREQEGIGLVRSFDRTLVLDDGEGSERPADWFLPQPAMKEWAAGVLVVRARPLNAAE